MSDDIASFVICPNPDCQEKLSCKAKFCSECGMKQAVANTKVSSPISIQETKQSESNIMTDNTRHDTQSESTKDEIAKNITMPAEGQEDFEVRDTNLVENESDTGQSCLSNSKFESIKFC